jgi:hypothetical protein
MHRTTRSNLSLPASVFTAELAARKICEATFHALTDENRRNSSRRRQLPSSEKRGAYESAEAHD